MRENWRKFKLGDFTETINGLWTGKKEPYIPVKVFTMSNFTKESDLNNEKEPREVIASLAQYEKRKLKYGDILIEKSGGGPNQPVGRAIFFNIKNNENNTFSNFTTRLRIVSNHINEIDSIYLHKYLKFIYMIGETEKFQKNSTNIRNLQLKEYLELEIPIPPLEEQKQIIAKLDKVFSAIDQAIINIEKNIENAIEFYENWVQELFENPKKNWQNKKWGELCHFVRGPFGGSLKKSMFKDEGYVVYEQKHAIHNHFNQLRYFIDEEKFNEMKRFEVKPGDIIMSCSGVTLGRVAIIPKDIPRGIINQALLKLTPNKDVSVDFIKYWLRSNIFQNIIFEHAGGAAIPNVPSAKILKEIIIPFPSLKEQHEVVSQIDLMNLKINEIKKGYLKKKEDLEELKKSVLQKAFEGQLTQNAVAV